MCFDMTRRNKPAARGTHGQDARATWRRRGFSLIEIMVVIVIIGLLAGVVGVNVRNYLIRSRQTVAKNGIASIVQAVDAFWTIYSRYPTNEEGIEILTKATPKAPEPFLKSMPEDPWGNRFEYASPGSAGQKYEVVSYGADGRPGGDGEDADIVGDDKGVRIAGSS